MRTLVCIALTAAVVACAGPPAAPLTRAAADNDVDAVTRLLAAGGAADEEDARGTTPLIAATRAGALDAIRILLAAGADPNRTPRRGVRWSPLEHAIHARQPEALRRLLEGGADPNRRSGTEVPIVRAAADPNPVFVELLLAHGANPRSDGNNGRKVISVAVTGGALRDINRPLFGGCYTATVAALVARDPGLRPQPDAVVVAKINGCAEVLRLVDP